MSNLSFSLWDNFFLWDFFEVKDYYGKTYMRKSTFIHRLPRANFRKKKKFQLHETMGVINQKSEE